MYANLEINTDRLKLKTFSLNDFEHLLRIVNDESLMKPVPFSTARTEEECKDLLDRILKRYSESAIDDFKGFLLNIKLKDANANIGFVRLFPLSYDSKQIELFYGIFEEYYNQGYALEAAITIRDYSFYSMNFNEIVSTVKPENAASIRVLEKIGMKFDHKIVDEESDDSSYQGELLYRVTK